jgi:catalase
MPLTTDERLLALSRETIEVFDKANGGVHPGFRPAHAKGTLLTGTFTPSLEAASLTRAPHLQRNSTPGDCSLLELRGNSDRRRPRPAGCRPARLCGSLPPWRACSYRHHRSFGRQLPGAHRGRAPGVPQCVDCDRPCRTSPECHRAVPWRASRGFDIHADSQADPDQLFAVSAFKFTKADGISRYGRYRVLPAAGNEYLGEAEAVARSPNFLFDEIKERVAREPVGFRVAVQLAEVGDIVDDATVRWPEDRPQRVFGEISLREIAPNNAGEQQHIIFDPIPRADGIEASADPLFEPRANVYLMSGRQRRGAGERL